MSLHDKKKLDKKGRKGWHCDKILVHLKEFGPGNKNMEMSCYIVN